MVSLAVVNSYLSILLAEGQTELGVLLGTPNLSALPTHLCFKKSE